MSRRERRCALALCYCGWCDCGLCGGGPPPYLNRLSVARAARLRSDGDGLAAEGEGTASSTQGRPLSWDCGGKPYSWSACARWSGCCSARGFDADWQAKPLISLDSDGSNSGSVAISMCCQWPMHARYRRTEARSTIWRPPSARCRAAPIWMCSVSASSATSITPRPCPIGTSWVNANSTSRPSGVNGTVTCP